MAHARKLPPRIVSIFYAIFHETHGRQIEYQVPEGLIAGGSSTTPDHTRSCPRKHNCPQSVATSSDTLFDFESIATYVLPPADFCGRLITISVRNHVVMGFPVRVEGHATRKRTFFQYNICFVFHSSQSTDLAPYEPVVRKIGRTLGNHEQESSFLSTPKTAKEMHSILEQIHEDLNRHAEASIPLDLINSLELKVLPLLPNPKPVYDWSVPVPFVDFSKHMDRSWDITMQQVIPHIDGISHVAKIALMSKCDAGLVRETVAHLLYYQTVHLIDIFQYSNVYAHRKSLISRPTEESVILECRTYVAPQNQALLEWPTLLDLYTQFTPGTSVKSWTELAGVTAERVDVRRFVTFGLIKGFLRRIHAYPYHISDGSPTNSGNSTLQAATTPTAIRPATINSPPDDLVPLLDGNHHTDQLCVHYGVGLAVLERWFASLKPQGKVRCIYR
ncbi:nitrogen permease regulator 2 [Auricularia subglabra TFB-10046 SS5]|uniref:Nitrogen permease regulator 2 n=1 Tax=Auricularia subglabra (strain TFB-10046 / SS5) TaxID=717982 RepID=J0LCI3_AURST|nr:nitrogen permease regulator 2 [Auricularia subglabra TFB-10046 SS5]